MNIIHTLVEVLFELSLQARFQGIAPKPLLTEFDIYHNLESCVMV